MRFVSVTAVNDPFVMAAWGESAGATGKVGIFACAATDVACTSAAMYLSSHAATLQPFEVVQSEAACIYAGVFFHVCHALMIDEPRSEVPLCMAS
jgi:hypothetical protein